MMRFFSVFTSAGTAHRITRQFGLALPPSISNTLSGLKLNLTGNESPFVFNRITTFVDDRLAVEIAGDILLVPRGRNFSFLENT